VRKTRDNGAEITTWNGVDNVPAVVHGAEPVRTTSAAIVALAARLGGPDAVLPIDPAARADIMGAIELIAGEDGLGWNGRLAMIDAGLTTGRGFSKAVAEYLARRYSYSPGMLPNVRERVATQLAILDGRLGKHGTYLAGAAVSALDVYAATFLTPLLPISEQACPAMTAPVRAAFECAAEAFGPLVSPALVAHHAMMFERHLEWPIAL
jgi:glutathione S-transferase